jgi:hypothetical protein
MNYTQDKKDSTKRILSAEEQALWDRRRILVRERNRLLRKPLYFLRFWLHWKVDFIDQAIDCVDKLLKFAQHLSEIERKMKNERRTVDRNEN